MLKATQNGAISMKIGSKRKFYDYENVVNIVRYCRMIEFNEIL